MKELFDALFQLFSWLMGVPVLYVIILAALTLTGGGKPLRSVSWVFRAPWRMISGLMRALVRSCFSSGSTVRGSSRDLYRYDGEYSGSNDRETQKQTGGRKRGRNNAGNF